MSDVRNLLEEAIAKFNQKVEEDERVAKELEGMERTIVVRLNDDGAYHFVLKDKRAGPLQEGDVEGDIEIISDSETLIALFNRELGPMKAIATKRLKINASLQDMLRIRKFF